MIYKYIVKVHNNKNKYETIMTKKLKISTRAPKGLEKEHIKKQTKKLIAKIAELQKVLYASGNKSLLILIQGIDAAGKDGLITKITTGLNPKGCTVKDFKAPTEEERKHDFLWRVHQAMPAKGMIQIFNRSHYEDVLITRVEGMIDNKTAQKRFAYINNFEQYMADHDTHILKFYLHISKKRQAERLTERANNPEKHWKHNPQDWITNKKWSKYMKMYEDVLENCNDPKWIIVPSDQNWYKEYVVAKAVYNALKAMKLEYPKMKVAKKSVPTMKAAKKKK